MITSGKAHIFGDHVDTDVIIPAYALSDPGTEALAKNCMAGIAPGFSERVSKGDILVAGLNFGCGSSREHAPIAIKACGISCIIAKSFARIFFRNCINIGLPALEIPGIDAIAQDGDILKIDISTGLLVNTSTGKEYKATALPPFMLNIINAGGLVAYSKQNTSAPKNMQ